MTRTERQEISSRRSVVALTAVCALVVASCANVEQGGPTAASSASVASAPPDPSIATTSGPKESRAPAVDREFADMVATYTDKHPEVFASRGWTGDDYSTLTIQVAEGQEDTPEVAWLRQQVPDAAHGGERVEFVTVTHSSATLEHIADLLRPRMSDDQINGLGWGNEQNLVRVFASREQIEEAGGEQGLLELLYSDLPEKYEGVLLLEESETPTVEVEVGPDTPLDSP